MNKRRIALILCFIMTICNVAPCAASPQTPDPGQTVASQASADNAEGDTAEAAEAGAGSDSVTGETTGADEGSDTVSGETMKTDNGAGFVTEEVVSDAACGGIDPELIRILEERGMTLNADGMYEYTDENGEIRIYDPEDPEIFKYFMEDEEEPVVDMAEDAVQNDSMLSSGGKVHSDPYKLWLDGRYYRYPKYYRTDDEDERAGIRYGIDVSKFQYEISEGNWEKLKDDYDIDFAFIRAGYRGYGSSGTLSKDEYFRSNIKNAYNAGLSVGVYFFSQAISKSEAREEANYCMDIIDSYKDMITLPVVIDYEYSGDPGRLKGADLSASEHTSIVNAFCDEVEDEGYTSMVYANKSMLLNDMDVSDISSDHLIWLANYVSADSDGIYSTSYSKRLSAWQFTSKYAGFGTGGQGLIGSQYVDMNFWYGDFPDESCKVTFNTNGGSKVASQTVKKGDKVKKPKDPTKKGHTFLGWYKDKKCTREWDFDSDTVKKDTTIYAKWLVNTYTVTFVTDADCEIEPRRIDFGQKIEEPVVSVKPGYTLEGWFTEPEYKKKWNFKKDTVQGDMTLYSKITANAVGIIYHDNGGWGTMEPTKGRVDETVIVAENKFTRQGYTYVSWNTAADGSGAPYKAGDSFLLTPSSNDLYAIWDPDIYTVIFDPGEGMETISENAACDSLLTEPVIAVSGDNIIEGWYQESAYQNRWSFATDKVRRNLTLYARWVAADEAKDWGDLAKDENKDARAMYGSPEEIPAGLWVYGIEDKAYTGAAITQDIKAFYGKKQLASGSDYTVKYSGNKNAGTASVTITGKGNYSGTDVTPFRITPLSISEDGVLSAPDISLVYNGKVQKGTTAVTYRLGNKNVTLKAETDFTCSYPGTKSTDTGYDSTAFVGKQTVAETKDGRGYEEYRVKITGKGNYSGEAEFTERIFASDKGAAVPVKKLKIASIPAQTLEYDGEDNVKPACPAVSVRDGGTELKPVSDNSAEDGYSLVYRNNTCAGKASVLVIGHGRYTGSKSVTFKVKALQISKASVRVNGSTVKTLPSKEYTGKEIKEEGCRLYYGNTELTEGRDYSVSYSKNINAGKATAIFKGEGIYSGQLKKTFTIEKIPLGKDKSGGRIVVYMDRSAVYKKGGAKPYIEVLYKDELKECILAEGRDYTLKYSNNKAVNDASNPKKIPTVQIIGKGNYSGKLTEGFRITRAPISAATMTASDIIYSRKADICKPKVQITDTDGKKLKAGTDYDKKIICTYKEETEVTRGGKKVTVSANDPVNAKDIIPLYTGIIATAKGKGNYAGSEVSAVFRFVSVDISKAEVKIANQYYTGKPVTITNKDILSVTLEEASLNKDNIEIVPGSYVNNINKGTAKVTVRGTGDYGGMRIVSFKISPRPVK